VEILSIPVELDQLPPAIIAAGAADEIFAPNEL
jgi:hypothetical protein